MTSNPDDILDHVFSYNTDSTWLNLDVLFVTDQPERDCFLERNNKVGRYCKAFIQITQQTLQAFRRKWILNYNKEPRNLTFGFAYFSNRWLGSTPSYKDLENESKELLSLIRNRYHPKVIVALGKSSSKILGIDIPTKKGRNKVYDIHIQNDPYKMVPTFGFTDLNNQNFKCETHMRLDLMKAFFEVSKGDLQGVQEQLKEEIKLHRYYRTLEQVQRFYDWFRKSGIKKITTDFETTGLRYQKVEERIIMLAMGLGHKMSVTILLDHREHPEPENLPAIWAIVKEILEDESIAKINHNIKFDYQMAIKEPYKITIKNIVWCTQLAEHLSYEEKSNGYNLDVMTSEYCPVFENYKKMVTPENLEIDTLIAELSKEEYDYTSRVDQWRNRKVTWESKSQFEMQKHKDDLAFYKVQKQRTDSQIERWNTVDLPHWQKSVDEWQKVPKKERGPKPKKPAKPKMIVSKPTSHKFKEKKPQKTDKHKSQDERLKQLKKGIKSKSFEDIDLSVLEVYAGIDGDVTYRIYELQKVHLYTEHEAYLEQLADFYILYPAMALPQGHPRGDPNMTHTQSYRSDLKQRLRLIYPSPLDLMATQVRYMPETIGDMEMRGSSLDYEKVKKMHYDMEVQSNSAKSEIQYHAKRGDINPNSDAEMRALLNLYDFEKYLKELDLPKEYTPQTKELSLSAKYIETWHEAFAKMNNPCAKILKALAKYRKSHKCKDTYLSNYIEYCKLDGKIHTEFFIYGTSGARLSSGNPNLQNIPKKETLFGLNIKDLFVPTVITGDTNVN